MKGNKFNNNFSNNFDEMTKNVSRQNQLNLYDKFSVSEGFSKGFFFLHQKLAFSFYSVEMILQFYSTQKFNAGKLFFPFYVCLQFQVNNLTVSSQV